MSTSFQTSLNNLKTKVDDLDFDKLKIYPIDMKDLNDVMSNEMAKSHQHDENKSK